MQFLNMLQRANRFGIRLAVFFTLCLTLFLVECGGGGGSPEGGNPADTSSPITIASPASGTYGSVQYVTLTSNEPATIHYSLDGSDPAVGAANTISGSSPLSGISIGAGTTVLKFFAVDTSQNRESVKQETYVVDLVSPTISLVGPAPTAIGLLATTNIGWQSDKAGNYVVELGGTGTPGSGTVLAIGTVLTATPVNQPITGSQLSYAASTPLWIYVTDSVGHTGSASVGFTLKPMVSINVASIDQGRIAVLPNGLKAYVTRNNANAVDVIDTNPASLTFNTVLTTIPVGIRPSGVAATPDGSRIYVTNGGATSIDTDSISAIATSTDTVTATIPLGTNSAPSGIAITPDGTRAYFLRFEGMISVLDINPANPSYHTITASISEPLLLMGSIAVTPDGARAVVNWQGSIAHAVDVLDVNPASPTYNTILSRPVPVVSGSGGDVAVTSDSNFAYVTDTGHLLCRINLQTFAIGPTGSFAPQWSFALTPDGTTILMGGPSSNNLRVLRASDLTLNVDVPMGAGLGFSGGIAIIPDGSRAYLIRDITSVNSQVVMVPLL